MNNEKKKINLLTCWMYDVNNTDFRNMIKMLNVKHCTYFYDNKNDIIEDSFFKPIYLYEKIDYFKDKKGSFEPLDESIIEKMKIYEQQCLDIIYRWRRSYTTKDSYIEIKNLYYTFLSYWNNYFIKKNINLVILTAIPHIPITFFPYVLAKIYDIPVIILNNLSYISGEKGNYFLQSSLEDLDKNFFDRIKMLQLIKENGDSIKLKPYMEKYFTAYTKNNSEVKRVIGYNQKRSIKKKLNSYFERIKIYNKKKEYKLLINKAIYLSEIKREEKKFLNKVCKYEENPVENELFLFFPLHMQPEATTLPCGGVFENQLLIIKMISNYLPKNAYLYVKEHPVYWTRKNNLESIKEARNISFYQEIKELKNVRLIDHNINSLDLIDKSKGLVTVTGTAGFEAIFKMKPVIVFGNIFYNDFKSVFKVKTNQECKNAIKCIFENLIKNYTYEDIRVYLKALEKYSVTLGTFYPASIDNGVPPVSDEDKNALVKCIINYYRDIYEN